MSLATRKITAFAKKVADLADTPQLGSTALLKQQFDSSPEELRVAHNGAMDDLTSVTPGSSGAENIGSAPISGVVGATSYAQMTDLKAQINSATTGALPDGSITPSKLSFDPTVISYAAATGVANTYAVTLNPAPTAYTEGMSVSVKINVQNTGASTINVNGLGAKSILKANGNAVASGNLKVNSVYTLRYNGTAFILQGEGGSGNAIAAHLLAGDTASTDAGDITGTMPNQSGAHRDATHTDGFPSDIYAYPQLGYYDGSFAVHAHDANFIAPNIPSNIIMFGLQGTRPIIAAGSSPVATANTLKGFSAVAWTKYKSATINIPGTYRVFFSIYKATAGSGGGMQAQIYKNGGAIGLLRSNTGATPVGFSEDFTFSPGDTVELWASAAGDTATSNIDSFEIRANVATVTLN